jgi:hypothetical protein
MSARVPPPRKGKSWFAVVPAAGWHDKYPPQAWLLPLGRPTAIDFAIMPAQRLDVLGPQGGASPRLPQCTRITRRAALTLLAACVTRHVECLQLVSETIGTWAPWSGQGPRPYQSCCCRHVCSFVLSGPVYLCVVMAGGLPLLSSSPESRRLESGRCDGNNWSLSSFCSMCTFCALVCHEPCWAQVLLFARRRLSVGFFFSASLPCSLCLSMVKPHDWWGLCLWLVSTDCIISPPQSRAIFCGEKLASTWGALKSIRNYSARNTLEKPNYDILYLYFS